MNIEQALQLVEQVFSQYKGTREEHVALQEAQKVLKEAVAPVAKEDKK